VAIRPYRDFKAEKVLFPTYLGPHAAFATQYALSVVRESSGEITFMHVVTLDEAFQQDRAKLVEDAVSKLEKLVPPEAKDWCKWDLKVEVGDPVKELLGYAEIERPDLIVLGLPEGKNFNSHFRTGVTYNVVAAAPCPVLTVRDVTK